MHAFRISSPARADIDDIAEYIRQDNPARAESFIDELYQKILQITERPLSFPTKTEISPATRSALHGKYLILFTLNDDLIDIIRIVHGARPRKPILTISMNVTQAVTSRRSVREYLDKPVDQDVLRRVLETAQSSPSGGNTQPWNAHILTGEPLQKLLEAAAAVLPQGTAAHKPEYPIYPSELGGRYKDSRFGIGEALYASLEIPRDNKMGRLMWFAKNFRAFDAPVLMLIHTPRYMGPPQWSDIGMWLQTVMLLLREAGLDSCGQEAWAIYQEQIRECVDIPEDHIFFCGMAIGYRDPDAAVNNFPVPREPLDEVIRWEGF